jgi:hypothetical protein
MTGNTITGIALPNQRETSMQNSELRRELSKIAALATAIGELAACTHADTLEAPMAELVMMVRNSYERLIDNAVMAGAVEQTTRPLIEDREDRESRLAATCGNLSQ